MCISMNSVATQNCIMIISLIATMGITIFLQYKSNKNNQQEFLDKQLIEIQRLSFYDPYVEDKRYTSRWNSNKEKYINNDLQELEKFLKYDVYTEMIFNFLEMSFKFYKNEKNY